MATKEFHLTVSTDDSTYSYSGATSDLTGYKTTVVIQTNTDCNVKIQYSDDLVNWDDYTPPDESSAEYQVDTDSSSKTLRLAKYVRVGAINNGAGITDTVAISFTSESETPVYTSASDVASYLGWLTESADDPDTPTRRVFSETTIPTLSEVNDMILASEDYIDELTGHAWREAQVVDEYHDYQRGAWVAPYERERDAKSISMTHRKIRQVVSGTDKIEVSDGDSWTDFVADKTEGRGNDYWIDYRDGILFFRSSNPSVRIMSVRLTYRYGETTVPGDIREACALMVARKLMMAHDYMRNIPNGADYTGVYSMKLREWGKIIDKTLETRKEYKAVN